MPGSITLRFLSITSVLLNICPTLALARSGNQGELWVFCQRFEEFSEAAVKRGLWTSFGFTFRVSIAWYSHGGVVDEVFHPIYREIEHVLG